MHNLFVKIEDNWFKARALSYHQQKHFLRRFFGAASWQDFCKFFMGTQFENSVGI
jgi:hypothetical protein